MDACLEQSTKFDSDTSLCAWREGSMPDSGQCTARKPELTLKVL
jgi:hypothetical protein